MLLDSYYHHRSLGRSMVLSSTLAYLFAYTTYTQIHVVSSQTVEESLPAQAVFVDPKTFAVLGPDFPFREEDPITQPFNPTNTSPPFFQVFDESFLSDVLGPEATIHEIASNDTFEFAYEAPVYVPETDEVFFVSGHDNGLEENNVMFKMSLSAAEDALAGGNNVSSVNVPVTALNLSEDFQQTNGGTGPYKSNLLMVTSGRGTFRPLVALLNPKPPYNHTVLLDNFYGRQFNSIDDVKIHPTNGKFFFTDMNHGFQGDYRPAPNLPVQVYVFDPETSTVRLVADGFVKSNGLAFSGDGKTAYVTDTGATQGNHPNILTNPSTIYAFDVDPRTDMFLNRRVLAFADTGRPDGIQVDSKGNVYAGCGDGVQVWNDKGRLLGKFFVGSRAVNMAFAGEGRLVIMAVNKIFLTHIVAEGINLGGP